MLTLPLGGDCWHVAFSHGACSLRNIQDFNPKKQTIEGMVLSLLAEAVGVLQPTFFEGGRECHVKKKITPCRCPVF